VAKSKSKTKGKKKKGSNSSSGKKAKAREDPNKKSVNRTTFTYKGEKRVAV